MLAGAVALEMVGSRKQKRKLIPGVGMTFFLGTLGTARLKPCPDENPTCRKSYLAKMLV